MNISNASKMSMSEAMDGGLLMYASKPVYRNSKKVATILNMTSPSFIVAQLLEGRDVDYAAELETAMVAFHQSESVSTLPRTFGLAVPVMVPDPTKPGAYCRGQIVDTVSEDQTFVSVNLVDLGVRVAVTFDCMRVMTKELMRLPRLAYMCKLYNILPADGEQWPLIEWKNYFLDKKEIIVTFIDQDQDGLYRILVEIDTIDFGVYCVNTLNIGNPVSLGVVSTLEKYQKYDFENWVNLKVFAFGVSVNSMESAWFQLRPDVANEIMDATEAYMDNANPMQKSEYFEKYIGAACLALFSQDNLWYRAEIIEIKDQGNYKVSFVDFGNKELVNEKQLIRIPEHLLAYPASAVEVVIADVIGIQGKEEFTKLKALVESTDLVVRIDDAHLNMCGTDRVLISVWQENGTSLSVLFSRPQKELEGPPINPPLTELASSIFCGAMIGGESECFQGVEYSGVVSFVESAKCVWLQLNNGDQKAEVLRGELQKFYSKSELCLHPDSIKEGLYCIAKQPCDNLWYRAILLSGPSPSGHCRVLFIDYGNDENVPAIDLKPLISYFALEKSLAMQTSLEVSVKESKRDDDVVNAILDFAEDKNLIVSMVHHEGINYATIKVDLGEVLVAAGLVEKLQLNPNGV